MDTKLKADISEQAVILRLLELGMNVLRPIGDRLAYDLVTEINGRFIKIQVKRAWRRGGIHIVDSRRTKTNRRRMVRAYYSMGDFDFAIVHIPGIEIMYVIPVNDFLSYRSEITFSEKITGGQRASSRIFREAWHFLGRMPK